MFGSLFIIIIFVLFSDKYCDSRTKAKLSANFINYKLRYCCVSQLIYKNCLPILLQTLQWVFQLNFLFRFPRAKILQES